MTAPSGIRHRQRRDLLDNGVGRGVEMRFGDRRKVFKALQALQLKAALVCTVQLCKILSFLFYPSISYSLDTSCLG